MSERIKKSEEPRLVIGKFVKRVTIEYKNGLNKVGDSLSKAIREVNRG